MNIKLFLFFTLCALTAVFAKKDRPDYYEITTEEQIEAYVKNKTKPSSTELLFERLHERLFIDLPQLNASTICQLCPLVAFLVVEERLLGMTDVQLTAEAAYVCSLLNFESDRVCVDTVSLNIAIFTYIMDNDNLSGDRMCEILLDHYECDNLEQPDWTVNITEGWTVDAKQPSEKNTIKILQLSDIHLDPLYTEGKTTNCGEGTCCQNDQDDASGVDDRCEYWTNYRHSDVPIHTIKEIFNDAVKREHDYVYFTGDIVSHRVWSTSPENNQKVITTIYDLFHTTFKKPVYFVLGNHEGHPVNVFAPEDITDEKLSSQWLYKLMSEKMVGITGTDASMNITILNGGHYTVSPQEGFRLIVLNDNVCALENWWLFHNDTDPYGQLQWMADVLEQAEKDNESVHILAHQPLSSCMRVWAREFNRILGRYANTIVGQFFGHTHTDEFYIYYNESAPTQPINVGWNGASVIADRSNPSYKIYTLDAETYQILDIEEYYFNLTKANADPNADLEFKKLYSFKEIFPVDNLDPTSMDILVETMAKNHTYLDVYYNNKFRNSDYSIAQGCDDGCRKSLLLQMVTTVTGVTARYEALANIYDQNIPKN